LPALHPGAPLRCTPRIPAPTSTGPGRANARRDIDRVYDAIGAATVFIALKNHRLILQDKSFVGNKVAITSVPYSRITSVSVVSNKSWAGNFFSSGAIAINVGTQAYEVEFRGSRKVTTCTA
jgi:hypothetical protein